MRHRRKVKQLGRIAKQRKALFQGLMVALIREGRIKTTLPKAKSVKPHIEKVISLAKKEGLATIRELGRIFDDKSVRLILDKWGPLFKSRKGGYTRIIRLNKRLSDASPMAFIEFVEKPVESKIKPKTKVAKAKKPVKNKK